MEVLWALKLVHRVVYVYGSSISFPSPTGIMIALHFLSNSLLIITTLPYYTALPEVTGRRADMGSTNYSIFTTTTTTCIIPYPTEPAVALLGLRLGGEFYKKSLLQVCSCQLMLAASADVVGEH